jgi:hypothetical protein
MTRPLNSGQRLARGVSIIAAVEPDSDCDIHGDVLYYGTSDERYSVEQEVELTKLKWYKCEGSWAFYT